MTCQYCTCVTLLVLLIHITLAQLSYKQHEPVPVIFDRLGPRENPSETYAHTYLKLCPLNTNTPVDAPSDFSTELTGGRRVTLNYQIKFLESGQHHLLCRLELTFDQVEELRKSIERHFTTLLFIDGLPILVPLGEVRKDHGIILFKHIAFHFKYNGDKVCKQIVLKTVKQ